MSLVFSQSAFLLDACKLIEFASSYGFTVTGGELWRSPEQQAIYVKTGRSKTMKSRHLDRMAIDLNFFRDGKLIYDIATLSPVGDYWEALHKLNSWGGRGDRFKDVPHFSRGVDKPEFRRVTK
jgi:peptidoglycan L-alanyl-D-glutamate endopeptidase CwlK